MQITKRILSRSKFGYHKVEQVEVIILEMRRLFIQEEKYLFLFISLLSQSTTTVTFLIILRASQIFCTKFITILVVRKTHASFVITVKPRSHVTLLLYSRLSFSRSVSEYCHITGWKLVFTITFLFFVDSIQAHM